MGISANFINLSISSFPSIPTWPGTCTNLIFISENWFLKILDEYFWLIDRLKICAGQQIRKIKNLLESGIFCGGSLFSILLEKMKYSCDFHDGGGWIFLGV